MVGQDSTGRTALHLMLRKRSDVEHLEAFVEFGPRIDLPDDTPDGWNDGAMKLSARNQLAGTILEVTPGAVSTTVKVELAGGDVITSSITKEAADDLALAPGHPVTVVVKASDVILAVD